ncbi:hypothetical protein PMAYCL1PPCAC_26299, partial [Pristionchus mayeri]
ALFSTCGAQVDSVDVRNQSEPTILQSIDHPIEITANSTVEPESSKIEAEKATASEQKEESIKPIVNAANPTVGQE